MIASSPESLAAFDQVLLDSCVILRPAEQLTCAEWADKYYYLSPEGSANPGKYYVATAEYQRGPLNALSDPDIETTVLEWGSQIGKTQIGLIFVGFTVHHNPMPILFVEPTESLASTVAVDRIMPMIRDTPVLNPLFPSGRKDPMHLNFPGGHLTSAWASSATELANRAIGAAVTDEEDRPGYEQNPEGDPIGMLRKRLATFPGRRKHLRISSPGLKRTSRIDKAFLASDQRRYFVPCPQCGEMQTLEFDRLKRPRYPETGRYNNKACYYVCVANGCEITHDDKYEMVRSGEWRITNPGGGDGRTAGFHLSALYSTIGYSWSEILDEYDACDGIPDKLQVFENTVLAKPWDEEAEGADMDEIQKGAEDYAAQAPEGVVFITCGADVQKDRIEGTKWGWGLQDQSWMIEHRVFHGDPIKEPAVWEQFEAWRSERVEHELGITLPTVCTFVDAGDGNRTQAVHQYTKAHQHLGVRASKGANTNSAPLVSEARPVGRLRALQVMVGTFTAKSTLYGRFGIHEKTRPGSVRFPRHTGSGASAQYFKHLTAEVLVTHQTRQGEISRWENPQKRNEALDCAVYAYAAKEFVKANMRALRDKLLEKVARLRERGELLVPARPDPAQSQSTVSSPASPSRPSASRPKPRKKLRRVTRPRQSWIRS